MDTLAIDLGTHCGYAYNRGVDFKAGSWHLAKPKEVTEWGKKRLNRRNDPRIQRLCDEIVKLGSFDAILFEDVQFSKTTYAAHLWAGLRSALWLCGVATTWEAVPVGTLKYFATGDGKAPKEKMAAFLVKEFRFSNLPELDDNGVDAVWLWIWAQRNLSRISK